MKKIFLFLCAASMLFALSEVQIKDYIAQNSKNIEQLQGTPSKIYASSPPLLYMLYALDPAKISGSNFEWNDYERPYVKKEVQEQPVVGGFFGQGKIPNVEMLHPRKCKLAQYQKDERGFRLDQKTDALSKRDEARGLSGWV